MFKIYANIAPYLSNPSKVKQFLEKNKEKPIKAIVLEIEKEMEKTEGLQKTDFQILLNEIKKCL